MSSVVPDGWIRGRLDSIVSKFIVPMRDKPKKFSGDIPWVRIEDFGGKYLSGSKSGRNVDRPTISDMNLKVYPKGTVLCSCSARLGVCTITSTELVSNQTFIGLYPSDGIDAEMLFYTMESHSEDLQKLSSGTTIAYLPREKFEEFEILVPPLPEQKKIASILTSVDEVIENTQKQIDKLQDLKKATMNELLTKGIGHTEFKDSELGRIPKSWEVVELSSLVNSTRPITYGIVQTGEHIPYGIPCVRVVDIVKGKPILERMIRTTQQINDSYSRTVLQENDIMFALRGNIGFVRKVESFLRGANLTRGIALISNSEEITSDYLLYALQSQVVRRQIADGVNGSALQEIPLGNLRAVKVPVPCNTEQTGISEVIASLEKLIETSLLKLSQTQSLKKSLMQDLLTGKVRVTVN